MRTSINKRARQQLAQRILQDPDFAGRVADAIMAVRRSDFYGDFGATLADEEKFEPEQRHATHVITELNKLFDEGTGGAHVNQATEVPQSGE